MEELDIKIVLSTANPHDILEYIKKHSVKGIYFLDVELEGTYNGVDVAKDIRNYDPRGFIIFITSHPQYMSLTFEYRVEALAYIQKTTSDIVCQKVCDCILNAYEKHVSRADDGYIFRAQNGRLVSCDYKDILFFETDPSGKRQLILHAKKRHYIIYSTLNDLSNALPVGLFFRCHKSFIVNVSNLTKSCIDSLSQGKDKMLMPDGTECLVSMRKRRSLLRCYIQLK